MLAKLASFLPIALLALLAEAREVKVLSGYSYDSIVDSIRGLSHGDTLVFAAGEYRLPGPLYFRSNITVRGELHGNAKLSILRRDEGFRGPYDPEKPRYCWNETDRHWVIQKGPFVESLLGHCTGPAYLESLTLQDLKVEGNPEDADIPSREQPFDLIRMAGNHVTIRNLEVRHSRNGGILLFGGEDNVIEDCVVENTARDGIFAGGTRGIKIRNNRLRTNRDNSIAFDCQNVAVGMKGGKLNFVDCGDESEISGNVIESGKADGMFRFHPDGTVKGYNFYGWSTSGADKDRTVYASGGIYVGRPVHEQDTNGVIAKVKGMLIERNHIKGTWLFGIRLDNGAENIVIRNNVVSAPECRLYGIGLDADDGAYYPRNVRLIGNTILTDTAPKVVMKRNKDVWFAGNRVSNQGMRMLSAKEIAFVEKLDCREFEAAKARMEGLNVDLVCP